MFKMNRQKKDMLMREMLNQIRHTSLSGNLEGCFYAYASETEEHIKKKFRVWLKLKKAGWLIWCEPIFKSGIRMDLLAYNDGIWTNYEILESETDEKLSEKIKKYPDINVVPIRSDKDIEELEFF